MASRKRLIAGAAVLLTFGATAAQTIDPVAQRVNWLSERLELTEEQQEQVQAIYAQEQEQTQGIDGGARGKCAIRKASHEKLSGVLTEDQNAKLPRCTRPCVAAWIGSAAWTGTPAWTADAKQCACSHNAR